MKLLTHNFFIKNQNGWKIALEHNKEKSQSSFKKKK